MTSILASLCFIVLTIAVGELDASDQAKLREIRSTLRSAGNLYRQNDWDAAATQLAAAKQQLDALPDTPAVKDASKRLRASWNRAQKLVREKQTANAKASDDSTPTREDDDASQVSFVADIAPLIQARCVGCHGSARSRAELRLDTFRDLMAGGENGLVVDRNNAMGSLMLLKMQGNAEGDRMPPNGSPVAEDWLAKFEQWIQSGAAFDGRDPQATLEQEMQTARRSRLSGEELRQALQEQTQQHWNLAFPGREMTVHATDHTLIALASNSNIDTARLGKQVETSVRELTKLLGFSKDVPFQGPLVLYVIPTSYDYAEWARMVEKRSVPPHATMHWKQLAGESFVVLGPKSLSDKHEVADDTRFTQLLSAAYLSQLGAPDWYAEGRGWLVRGQKSRRDPQLQSLRSEAPRVLAQISKAEELFEARLPAGQLEAATWAFAAYLDRDRKRSRRLLDTLAQGQAFEQTFQHAYGRAANDICTDWLKSFQRKRPRRSGR